MGGKRSAYLTIPTLKVLILAEASEARVTAHRRRVDRNFEIECHLDLDAGISLPEVDAALPLAELYDRVVFDL